MSQCEKPVSKILRTLSILKQRLLPACSLASFAVSCVIGVSPAGDGQSRALSLPILAIRFYQTYISDLRYGRCRFEPSCSQYALEAIEQRGLVVGSALAADRLIRCNRSAVHFHVRGPGGRLLDPVQGDTYPGESPVVPSWLLPQPLGKPPLPKADADTGPAVADLTASRLIEYAEFGDALAAKGDCWRAQTEYERVAHIGGTRELEFWAQMKAGECLFSQQDWEESATRFSKAATLSAPGLERNTSCFMIAASHFNAGSYAECREILNQCLFQWTAYRSTQTPQSKRDSPESRAASPAYSDPAPVTMESWLFLNGLCSMALAEWDGARERFSEISRVYPESANREAALFLEDKAKSGYSLPRRSPTAASVFSAILPGSGQIYTGRTYDGMRHFVFNGLLGYLVYHLAEDENYAGTYLLAGVALPFYAGNIVGAKRSAEQFNRSRQIEYLSQVVSTVAR